MLSKYIPAITIISLLFFITQCQQLDDNKRSPSTDGATVEIKPELVSPVNSSHNQSTSIAFNWSKMEGVNEFRFQLSTNAGFQSMLADTIIEGRSLLINSLELNSNYFWKVYPILEHDNISWSDTWRFKTATSDVEPIVTELHSPELGEYVTPQDLIFQWEAIHGVSQYYLQLARENDFNATLVDTLISTESLSVDELDNDNEYQWRVLPVAESFTGHWSEINDFILVDENDVEKSKVSLVAPENQSEEIPTEVILEWKKLSDFEHYSVQLSEDESFETQVSDTVVQALSFEAESLSNSTTYYWRVIPSSDSGLFTWSDTWQFTTMEHEVDIPKVQLGQPENSAEELPTDVSFEWEPADGFDRYQFQLSTESDFSSTVTNETVNDNTIIAEGLDHETDYHWRVRIRYDGNSGPWSEVRSFTTEQQEEEIEIPAVSLVAPENNSDEVPVVTILEWEQIDDADVYQIMINDDNSFSDPLIDETVSGTSFDAENLEPETTYYWGVRAQAGDDIGEWSQTWSFTTEAEEEDVPEMGRVTLSSPTDGAVDQPDALTFEWDAMTGTEHYRIMVDESNEFTSSIIDETVTDTSFDAEGLEPGTTYYWGVRAQAGDEVGEWSQTWSFSTESTQIGQVVLSSPSDGASNQPTSVTLSWQELQNADEYQVQLASNSSFSNLVDDELVFSTPHNVSGLNNNQTYYWRVRGVVGSETGDWSAYRQFSTEGSSTPPPSSDAFVSANNGNFYADGQLFRFVGTNAYYLPNYEKLDAGVVNRAFNIFEETGITVIRMWAFYDGYDCGYSQHDSSENVIQTSPGVYSESALRDLDRVIAKGKERGIRFILPLVNYWDELGGICQYNTWAGASSPSQNMDFFINNSDTQKWFREYIEMLLNRVNTVTGVAYKDEPAIFAWQIINEGRNSGANPRILRDWYQEIAQFIKSITPNHMVSTGEEGFDEGTPSDYSVSEYSNTYVLRANEGTSYIMNTSIPEIDFGSAHWYPADWGFGTSANSSLLDAQRAWLSDHQNIAEDLGKPFVLGEWGFEGWGNSTQLTIYDNLYEHAESIQLDGSLLWQLTADGTKCWEFGGNICYPDGRQDTELYNRFRHHVQQVNNQ